MSEAHLPSYDETQILPTTALLSAVVETDQFDDWIPDPVYYREVQRHPERARSGIDAAWERGILDPEDRTDVFLPRSTQKLRATAWPLASRACIHRVIAAMGGRMAPTLDRDRVFGFRLVRGVDRVFDMPCDELTELFEQVFGKATLSEYLQVTDVTEFLPSLRRGRLADVWGRAGAWPSETKFLRDCLLGYEKGVPSSDDAWAFLYNFALLPVDQELSSKGVTFLRHRDSYFTFDWGDDQRVREALHGEGLEAVNAVTEPEIDLWARDAANLPMEDEWTDVPDNYIGTYVQLPSARIRLEVSFDFSDSTEIEGIDSEGLCESDWETLQAALDDPAQLDAIRLVPLLRRFHKGRSAGVLLVPPFEASEVVFNEYRTWLGQAPERWLLRALGTAARAEDEWSIACLAQMASDIGPLPRRVERLMLSLVESGGCGTVADCGLRVALARSGLVMPARLRWEPSTTFERRSECLAAYYSARRGSPEWWLELRAHETESLLKEALGEYI